jgi:hypothetical protein
MPTLQIGSTGEEVKQWQLIVRVEADGEFGPRTDAATRAWQQDRGLVSDGVVGPLTLAAASRMVPLLHPFVGARHFTKGRYGSAITLVVIHTMEAPEKPFTARAVAEWFGGPKAPQASAHYCIDAAETIQCVQEQDAAWAAPGANRTGIHIEHAGYSRQNASDWADEYSSDMLLRSAVLVADVCARYAIPIRRLSTSEVRASVRGICGHVEVTRAFGKSDHTDPGPNFPWERYLALVGSESKAGQSAPAPAGSSSTVVDLA